MEHTLESNEICPWELWLDGEHIANVHGSAPVRQERVKRIIEQWNEHDPLQAKADLFDEMVKVCESALHLLRIVGKGELEQTPAGDKLTKILAKAKGIK